MGTLFEVKTEDGQKKLDLAEASRMTIVVGGIEYIILPPNIAPLFPVRNPIFEQSQRRIDAASAMTDELRKRAMDTMFPPKPGQS